MTPESRRLTESYRQGVLALRAAAVRDVVRLWPALDAADLNKSWPALEAALETLVASRRKDAVGLASSYLKGIRKFEGVVGPLDVVLADEFDMARLKTSLHVTGPVAIKRATGAGKTLQQAAQTGLVRVSGAVTRFVLEGGRETITQTVAADPRAVGWARDPGPRACSFCAMLATRGGVYTEDTVGFESHDHCTCQAVPVYSDYTPPEYVQRWGDLYAEATVNTSGDESVAAFRKAFSGG